MVLGLLRDDPSMPTAAILEHVRGLGYPGGKSALYALVDEVRTTGGFQRPAAIRQAEVDARRQANQARRAERAQNRARWSAEARERKERRAKEQEERRQRHALAAQQREAERVRRVPSGRSVASSEPQAPSDPARLRAMARAWLASRKNTHKNNVGEWSIWGRHLDPVFGDLLPAEVDVPRIRAFVEETLSTGLSSTTVGHCVGLLSSLFTDLVERDLAGSNPVRKVPRAVKRLYRHAHDPRDTPFIEDRAAIERLASELPDPLRTMFRVGVSTGLRTGELVALRRDDIRHGFRALHVQRRFRMGKVDTPKSGKGRIVPLSNSCAMVLRDWCVSHPGDGLVFEPVLGATDKGHLHIHQLMRMLGWKEIVSRVGLPRIGWYEATRHTFASQLVMSGYPLEKVSKLLGHADIGVTQRYAHLRPESLVVPDVISFEPTARPGAL